MRRGIVTIAVLGITMLAACGGGGTTTPTIPLPSNQPGPPATQPTTQPKTAPQGNVPVIDTVGGSPAYVDPANHHTLYYVDGDTPPGTACPAGFCTGEWPPISPTAVSQPSGNLVIVTRIDGTMQWSENGHALYHFAFDSGQDQMNGVYGPWHVARP